ncbi:MAG: hypothetical protein LUD69_02710 [Oscillospiraceae bacterium]|nr:hypothetical protein [Oscillospiraceae bacterium]
MKNTRCILKIAAAVLALGAAICCVAAFWDNLQDALESAKAALPDCRCRRKSDDYIDWDEEA